MKNNQNGFGAIEGILLILIIGVVATVAWLAINRQSSLKSTAAPSNTTASNQTPDAQKVDPYKDWKAGSFKLTKLSYKLPPNWQDTTKNTPLSGGYQEEVIQITSADGLVLSMSVNNIPHGYEGDPNNVVLEYKDIDSSHQWVIADNANGKVSRIYVGKGISKVGDKILAVPNVPQDGLSVIISAEYKTELGSLAEFNQKQSVKDAKLVFESLKFN